ncbi:MAG TPA: ABC transporter permease subunit [Anaerohalosphaeraceae bacterium]|nr:ABC transporter permease subunit [Anaerohalosphaeraceae bacterium]
MLAAMDTFRLRFSERLWRISPMRLAGPSLDKELRTASRRKRTYGYRLLYVVGLLLMVLPYWTDAFYVGRTPIPLQQARMAEGVVHITSRVMWFQFLTLPMASVILLSGAFSEEIAKRTLGVLMTTPISGFQMVAGKLLSALSQLVMLMLQSVPILMIMGIYGGLDWRFIAAATALTFCCSLTAGLTTVWVSTYFKRATVVIMVTLLLLTMAYIVAPQFLHRGNWLGYINPLTIFVLVETSLYQGLYFDYHDLIVKLIDNALLRQSVLQQGISPPAAVPYGLFCIFQVMVSFGVLIWSAKRVRKKGYQLFSGQGRLTRWFTEPSEKAQRPIGGKPIELKPLRTVTGNAMIWKELRSPMLRRRKLKLAAIVSPLILLNAILFLSIMGLQSQARWLEVMMPLFLIMIGLSPFVLTLLFSAGAISSEKESGTWPILLVTPLSGWTILLGKIVGIIKKTCIYWLSVLGLLWIVLYVGQWPLVTSVLVLPIAGQIILWICASGLFWGSLVRKTASSVVLTILFLFVCWAPGIYFSLFSHYYWYSYNSTTFLGYRYHSWIIDNVICLNPFMQLKAILQDEYQWPIDSLRGTIPSTVFVFCAFVLYCIVSFVLLAITQRLIRRRIF